MNFEKHSLQEKVKYLFTSQTTFLVQKTKIDL